VIQPSNSSSRNTNDEKYLYRSFEIPRWGNVFLLNSTLLLQENGIQKQQQKEMDLCFGLFLSQLRRLLGFPSFQKRQQQMEEETLHTSTSTTSTTTTTTTTTSKSKRTMIYFLPAIKDGFAQWELDVVVRQKIMENIKTTIQTLDSIVHLVNEMPQMSVLKRIEKLVTKALEEMEQVIQILSDQEHVYHHPFYQVDILYQQILPKTLDGAKAAEEAYYDHTMIRQLYFPQEQMFGVYAPLLAPLFLPFFLGFIREFKRFLLKKSTKLIVSKEN
jgi:phosphatidylinositol glycan class S